MFAASKKTFLGVAKVIKLINDVFNFDRITQQKNKCIYHTYLRGIFDQDLRALEKSQEIYQHLVN